MDAKKQNQLERQIAELTQANQALTTSHKLMEAILETVPDRIYFKDRESRFLKLSLALAKRMRINDPREALGKTDFDYFTPEKAEEFRRDEQRVIESGKPMINKIERQITAAGEVTWASVTKVPVRDDSGNVIGIVGVNRDVTDQKNAEEELRKAKDELEQRVAERTAELSKKNVELEKLIAEQVQIRDELAKERHLLRTLIDKLPDYIFVKDAQSRFTVINTACAHQLGARNAEAVIGKSDADFVTAELAEQYRKDELALMESGKPMHKEEPFLHQETGEKRWSLTTKIPLQNEAGKVVGLMGIARDITEIKEAEKKMEAMHRELREVSRQAGMAEVATGVLHNVGNVLNSVTVAADLIRDRLRNSKASGITKVSKLLTDHSSDLSRFLIEEERGRQVPVYLSELSTHLEQERAELQEELHRLGLNIEHIKEIVAAQQSYARVMGIAEVINVSDLIEDALKIQGAAYERHGIKIVRDYDPLPTISTDKHRILQIIVNLLNNAKYACDATNRKDKCVTVRLKPGAEGRVKIEVADNGIGIPKENLERIFTQGFTTRKGGHGFGLHSGILAAQELGGSLSVRSEGHAKGATFLLELPISPPAEPGK